MEDNKAEIYTSNENNIDNDENNIDNDKNNNDIDENNNFSIKNCIILS